MKKYCLCWYFVGALRWFNIDRLDTVCTVMLSFCTLSLFVQLCYLSAHCHCLYSYVIVLHTVTVCTVMSSFCILSLFVQLCYLSAHCHCLYSYVTFLHNVTVCTVMLSFCTLSLFVQLCYLSAHCKTRWFWWLWGVVRFQKYM